MIPTNPNGEVSKKGEDKGHDFFLTQKNDDSSVSSADDDEIGPLMKKSTLKIEKKFHSHHQTSKIASKNYKTTPKTVIPTKIDIDVLEIFREIEEQILMHIIEDNKNEKENPMVNRYQREIASK